MPSKRINILQISDLHFGMPINLENPRAMPRSQIIDAFEKKLDTIPPEWKPDILLITGDIAFTGKEEEFQEFSKFLANVRESLNHLSVDYIICCPGNHDRTDPGCPAENWALPDDEIENKIVNGEFNTNFDNYIQSISKEGIPPLKTPADCSHLWGYRIINIDGINLIFVSLNSAWLCNHSAEDPLNDYGNMRFGKELVFNTFHEVESIRDDLKNHDQQSIVTAIYHHDFGFLNESERITDDNTLSVTEKILSDSDITLFGHSHVADNYSDDNGLHIRAAAIHSNDTNNASANLLQLVFYDTIPAPYYKLSKLKLTKLRGRPVWEFVEGKDLHPVYLDAEDSDTSYILQTIENYLNKFKEIDEIIQRLSEVDGSNPENAPDIDENLERLSKLGKDISGFETTLKDHVSVGFSEDMWEYLSFMKLCTYGITSENLEKYGIPFEDLQRVLRSFKETKIDNGKLKTTDLLLTIKMLWLIIRSMRKEYGDTTKVLSISK